MFLPINIAPASVNKRTVVASAAGMLSIKDGEPAVVGMAAVSKMSFSEMGMPCNGPRTMPCVISRSAVLAFAMARSAVTWMKLRMRGSYLAMRSSDDRIKSTGESSPPRNSAFISLIESKAMSSFIIVDYLLARNWIAESESL